jgi:nitroreductase
MTYAELIRRRESCRDYADRPVEKEKIVECLEAARLAPSACNSQPWSYIAVLNREKAKAIAKATQGMGMNRFTDRCPAFVIVTEEPANILSWLGGTVKKQRYALIDVGLSVSQFCYTACELGLSTCILGWFDDTALKKIVDVPEGKTIRLVIAVGYAATDKIRPKQRKTLSEISQIIE